MHTHIAPRLRPIQAVGTLQMVREGCPRLKDVVKIALITPSRYEQHLRGFMTGPPCIMGYGHTRNPTLYGRRGRVYTGAGGIDVHRWSRWIISTQPTGGGETILAFHPPPNLEILSRLLAGDVRRCCGILQQSQQLSQQKQQSTQQQASFFTTSTRALMLETMTLFSKRSVHARVNFQLISLQDWILSSSHAGDRRTHCGLLVTMGNGLAAEFMATLSASAAIASVLWDSGTGLWLSRSPLMQSCCCCQKKGKSKWHIHQPIPVHPHRFLPRCRQSDLVHQLQHRWN